MKFVSVIKNIKEKVFIYFLFLKKNEIGFDWISINF